MINTLQIKHFKSIKALEKCPAPELSVVGVTYEDHATKARRLSKAEVIRLLEGDPFFQLDSVLRARTGR